MKALQNRPVSSFPRRRLTFFVAGLLSLLVCNLVAVAPAAADAYVVDIEGRWIPRGKTEPLSLGEVLPDGGIIFFAGATGPLPTTASIKIYDSNGKLKRRECRHDPCTVRNLVVSKSSDTTFGGYVKRSISFVMGAVFSFSHKIPKHAKTISRGPTTESIAWYEEGLLKLDTLLTEGLLTHCTDKTPTVAALEFGRNTGTEPSFGLYEANREWRTGLPNGLYQLLCGSEANPDYEAWVLLTEPRTGPDLSEEFKKLSEELQSWAREPNQAARAAKIYRRGFLLSKAIGGAHP